jgi:hypothetical protein
MQVTASQTPPLELPRAASMQASLLPSYQQTQQQLQQAVTAKLAALWQSERQWLRQPHLTQVSICCLLGQPNCTASLMQVAQTDLTTALGRTVVLTNVTTITRRSEGQSPGA